MGTPWREGSVKGMQVLTGTCPIQSEKPVRTTASENKELNFEDFRSYIIGENKWRS